MHIDDGIPQSECRVAENGEVINLVETLDGFWRIQSYECRAGVALHREGTFFEWMQGLPSHWTDLTFSSPDDAVEFAQQQMRQTGFPATRLCVLNGDIRCCRNSDRLPENIVTSRSLSIRDFARQYLEKAPNQSIVRER